jgi:hypothetical protein
MTLGGGQIPEAAERRPADHRQRFSTTSISVSSVYSREMVFLETLQLFDITDKTEQDFPDLLLFVH